MAKPAGKLANSLVGTAQLTPAGFGTAAHRSATDDVRRPLGQANRQFTPASASSPAAGNPTGFKDVAHQPSSGPPSGASRYPVSADSPAKRKLPGNADDDVDKQVIRSSKFKTSVQLPENSHTSGPVRSISKCLIGKCFKANCQHPHVVCGCVESESSTGSRKMSR